LEDILSRFRSGDIDILVGTQMLAKGHDFPRVTLIALLEVDQMLSLPDFRVGERTFQLIVQASGRAGRAEFEGRVMLQTSKPKNAIIRAALSGDYEGFARKELEFRRAFGYAPFTRMVGVELNSSDRIALDKFCVRIQKWFESLQDDKPYFFKEVKILGPSRSAIEVIRGRHRRSILLISSSIQALRRVLDMFLATFQKAENKDIIVKVDVDPQNLI
jgi:primosomal protein N' (replication factor Y)